MLKAKKLLVVVGLTLTTTTLSGCSIGTWFNQSKQISQYEAQIENQSNQIKTLQSQLDNLQITEVTPETSLKQIEGAEVPTFETIDGALKFPNAIQVPNSGEDINNSNVMVGSMFRFVPSNNWVMRMRGTTLEFSHPTKVWGSIKSVSITDPMPANDMQPVLQGFFNTWPKTTIRYRKVFIEDNVAGMIASADLTINDKPSVVNVGFIQRGDYAVLVLFQFEKQEGGVQQELVDLLLSSGTFADSKIKLE